MKFRVSTLTIIILLIANICFAQGKIDRSEKSLEKEESTTSSSSDDGNDDDDVSPFEGSVFEDVLADLFAELFFQTFKGIFWGSPEENKAILTKYPYYNSNNGNYSNYLNENSANWRGELIFRYITESSNIKGSHINFNLRFYDFVAVELDYLQLWEKSQLYDNNSLAAYTMLVKYNRVRTKRFNAWWGLGASYIDGAVDKYGFSYGIGAEFFIQKPISLESSFGQTILENSNTINTFNGLVNYHLKRYKIQGGYEYLKIGDVKFSTITIGTGIYF